MTVKRHWGCGGSWALCGDFRGRVCFYGRPDCPPVVIPAQAGIQGGLRGCQFLSACARLTECHPSMPCPLCGHGLYQALDSGLRRNDGGGDSGLCRAASGILGGLFQTRLYHLGGLFPTPLYHLHPCRRACAGMTVFCVLPCLLFPCYFPKSASSSFMDRKSCMRREGMDAHSRPAQAGIQEGGGGM